MWHAMLTAIGIEPLAPRDAAARLQAALWIIQPAMDHLAVARGGLEPNRVGAFEDDDLTPSQGQGARRGEADHPGADHDPFDFVHPRLANFRLRPSGGRGRGPSRQRWEGEVGKLSGIPHLTPALSDFGGGEG